MIFHKLSAFLLVAGLLLQTTAFAARAVARDDEKAGKLSPELKRNALELLSEAASEAAQFKLPQNRIRAGTIAAGLLWEHDEQAARRISQNVFAELQNLFGQINSTEAAELSATERTERFHKRHDLSEFRSEYVLMLAAHDAQAAQTALGALKARLLEEEYDPLRSNDLELQLASAVAKKDPERAFALAEQQLAEDGIAHPFVESLKELHRKNSGLAAKLGAEVLAKIRNAKIRVPTTAQSSETPNTTPNSKQIEIDFWKIANFINAASEMNRRAARDKEKKTLPVLGENEMREAVDLIVRAYLAERNPSPLSIAQVMAEIKRYAPAEAQRIRLKIGAKDARELDYVAESAEYHYVARKEKNADELALEAESAAPDKRDHRYADAADKALEAGEPEKAKEIAARIKDRKGQAHLLERIQAALPLAKARRGDATEVRKMLAALKTDDERIAALTELASALAARGERETAKNLLDESLQMMPAPLKKQTDLHSAVKIALAFSAVAPEQAFTIVENGIGQTNEYINAGIRLGEFFDFGSVENGELLYDLINRQALRHAPNSVVLLNNLARADFERTVRLADKFERPEIRVFARLLLAQTLLDAEAAEKESKARERMINEYNG